MACSPCFTTPIPCLSPRTRIIAVMTGTETGASSRILLSNLHVRITKHHPLDLPPIVHKHDRLLATVPWLPLTDTSRLVQLDIFPLIGSHPLIVLQDASLNLGAVRSLTLNLRSPIHMGRLQTVPPQPLIRIHVFRPAALRSVNVVSRHLTGRHSSSRETDVCDTAPETALHIQTGMNLTMFHGKQSRRCSRRSRQQSANPAHRHQTGHAHARPDR